VQQHSEASGRGMPPVTTPSRMWVALRRQLGRVSSDQHVHHSVPVQHLRDPPRIELSIHAHDRPCYCSSAAKSCWPYDSLRAAPGSAALRYARSSTFRENILDEHEHRRRPADVAATYSEPNEQTLDAWRGETNQWEAIDTDRGATE
jgi:hypothetical protein